MSALLEIWEPGELPDDVAPADLAELVAGEPFVDLNGTAVDPEVVRLIPRHVSLRYGVVAYGVDDDAILVAMTDPTNVVAADDVRLYTGARRLQVAVATSAAIGQLVERVWRGEDAEVVEAEVADATDLDDDDVTASGSTIVRIVNHVFADAMEAGASDVHLEPEGDGLRVRFRVDGVLRDVRTFPRELAPVLTSRIKIMAGLDIAERRRPQDGRARLELAGRTLDARVSTLPTMHGEKLVVRLLLTEREVLRLDATGMSHEGLDTFRRDFRAAQGLVLIAGPTGSGKTTTLYAALDELRRTERNLVTLEDPVEIQLAGVNQVQINERAGLTFAAGLRSVLRQDPDVILVGEVRDAQTAELAMQASLTGHLVFSTVHANDASAAVTRLIDIGIPPFLIASSLTLVVAQRLVRRVCDNCAVPAEPDARTLQLLGLSRDDVAASGARQGTGCVACGGSGYRGRMGLFELLPMDARLRRALLETRTEGALRAAARSLGVASLRADGVAKAMLGETTFDEVLRVTPMDVVGESACRTCGAGLDEDMLVCPVCTATIEHDCCVACARHLEPHWRVCPWCRTAREAGRSAVLAELAAMADATAPCPEPVVLTAAPGEAVTTEPRTPAPRRRRGAPGRG